MSLIGYPPGSVVEAPFSFKLTQFQIRGCHIPPSHPAWPGRPEDLWPWSLVDTSDGYEVVACATSYEAICAALRLLGSGG